MSPFYIFLFPAFHSMLKIPLLLPSRKDSSIRRPSFPLCKTFHHTPAALFLLFLTLNVFLSFLDHMKVWPQQDFHNFCVLGISDGCHGLILACLAMLAPLPSEPLDTTPPARSSPTQPETPPRKRPTIAMYLISFCARLSPRKQVRLLVSRAYHKGHKVIQGVWCPGASTSAECNKWATGKQVDLPVVHDQCPAIVRSCMEIISSEPHFICAFIEPASDATIATSSNLQILDQTSPSRAQLNGHHV